MQLLTLAEAARQFPIEYQTLRYHVRRGRLRADAWTRIGKPLVHPATVEAFIKLHCFSRARLTEQQRSAKHAGWLTTWGAARYLQLSHPAILYRVKRKADLSPDRIIDGRPYFWPASLVVWRNTHLLRADAGKARKLPWRSMSVS